MNKSAQHSGKSSGNPIPSLARLEQQAPALRAPGDKTTHLLVILPTGDAWRDLSGCLVDAQAAVLDSLRRTRRKPESLAKQPLSVELPGGRLSVWLRLDAGLSTFERLALLRRAMQPLLDEHPETIDIAVYGDTAFRADAARAAVQVAWLNGTPLASWKGVRQAGKDGDKQGGKQAGKQGDQDGDKPAAALAGIHLHGVDGLDFAREQALAEASLLTRQLAWLPPNLLTPTSYRERIRSLAKSAGWTIEEYDIPRLEKMKAGAFLAVARGSPRRDAAIVRLTYNAKGGGRKAKASQRVALVGKGICFDTGGHNLKPARYMHNMHDDMNGSAVCLGVLLAASRLKLPVNLEVWLAIAENHISPSAYTQNEVVTALNGTTIEVMHTDAEGRMVLADTLTLAAREKPALIVDFATLTGSMAMALGDRMSGVIASGDALAARAVAAGQACGERVVAFPMPEDYDEALESKVADVKQCTLEGEADHILAARFLSRFVDERPWLHVDLSATRCKGGLGGVGSEVTGFGVGLGLALLEDVMVDAGAVTAKPGNVR